MELLYFFHQTAFLLPITFGNVWRWGWGVLPQLEKNLGNVGSFFLAFTKGHE
jgi:hypothetical protein